MVDAKEKSPSVPGLAIRVGRGIMVAFGGRLASMTPFELEERPFSTSDMVESCRRWKTRNRGFIR